MLDAALISQMLMKPEVAPRQCQLVDAPDADVPKQKKLKKPIGGFLEFHVSGSEIPDMLRSHFGCDSRSQMVEESQIVDNSFALPLSPGFQFTDQRPVSPIDGRRTPESDTNSLGGHRPSMIHRPVASHHTHFSTSMQSIARSTGSSTARSHEEESMEYLEEQARVELLIREAAKMNIEARNEACSSGSVTPLETPPP